MKAFTGMTDLSNDLTDFGETAALMQNLDLVITVDTSMGHLAGAMARPVLVMVPKAADWRWQLERDDSPWYPNRSAVPSGESQASGTRCWRG